MTDPNEEIQPECAMFYAKDLAAAQTRYARAFLMAKRATWSNNPPVTDGQAHQQALDMTEAEITVAQARYDIAMALLKLNDGHILEETP